MIPIMKSKDIAFQDIGTDVVFQRKYDGSRHVYALGSLYSEREVLKDGHFPHIIKELTKITGDVILDGEVYVEGGTVLDLNKKENWHKAKFCAFDVLHDGDNDLTASPFSFRREVLKEIVSKLDSKIVHLPVEFLDYNEAWAEVEKNEWEGLMVKDMKGQYHRGKRTRDWGKIKRKLCVDVEIVGHEKGSTKGTFIIRMPNGVEARLSGTSEDIVDYWYEHQPKKCEISYMFLTGEGKPFQPVFNKFVEE